MMSCDTEIGAAGGMCRISGKLVTFPVLLGYSKKEVARNVMSISGGILQFSLAVSWQAGSFHRDFCSLCDNGEILLCSFVLLLFHLGLKAQCLFSF